MALGSVLMLAGVVLQSSILNYNSNCAVFSPGSTDCTGFLPSYAAVGTWFGLTNPVRSDLGPFLGELPLQLRELLLGQHRVLRGGGDFSPQVRSRPLSLDQTRRERVFFGRKFCTFGPERGEALFTRHQRRITRLQFVHQLVARRLLVGQGITQGGQEILLLGRNIRREFGHRCLLRPHWLRSLPTRQREEIEQQKITEDQQQGAVHDESLPSACDSMMSSRL